MAENVTKIYIGVNACKGFMLKNVFSLVFTAFFSLCVNYNFFAIILLVVLRPS